MSVTVADFFSQTATSILVDVTWVDPYQVSWKSFRSETTDQKLYVNHDLLILNKNLKQSLLLQIGVWWLQCHLALLFIMLLQMSLVELLWQP